MNTFGLDIGYSTMKAVYLERRGNDVLFKSSIIAKTPANGIQSDAFLDQEEIAQSIRKMILDGKIQSRTAHLSIPDNQVFAKVIDMPFLSDKELASAIYWEAEQHIPVPLSTINIDWHVLRRGVFYDNKSKMQVLLVGATISLLSKYQKIMELAGINIGSVEPEMLSVIRSLDVSDQFPTSLVVNIGGLGSSLAIVQKGVLVFLYSVPLGGIAMNRSIANEFSFNAEQAEEYKKTYGLEEKNFGGKIRVAIEPILLSLIGEIKKAISYYLDKYKDDHPIKQIILTGGTAKLPGIIPVFVQQTGIETVVANPWKTLHIKDVPPPLTEHGPEYSIGIGLAIKDI